MALKKWEPCNIVKALLHSSSVVGQAFYSNATMSQCIAVPQSKPLLSFGQLFKIASFVTGTKSYNYKITIDY
jgi:hypothetical protein